MGYRASGALGALVALIGVAMPSFLIITAVAMGFSHLPMDNIYVQGAFIGVRSALGGLVLAALLRTWKKMMTDWFAYVIAFGCFGGVIFGSLNPAWLLLGAMAAGIVYLKFTCRKITEADLAEGNKQA